MPTDRGPRDFGLTRVDWPLPQPSGIRRWALPIAFVAAIITAGLLVVVFLDNPYSGGNGSINPTEMTRTLVRIDHGVNAPCDARGHPT